MSIYSVGNSAAPSMVGYGGLALSVMSGLSLVAGGPAILDVPGDRVIDFAISVASFFTAGAILKSRDPTAAWLGGALLAVMVIYAGLNINLNQAGSMLSAAKNAATSGARAATYSVANGQPRQQQWATLGTTSINTKKWVALRELKPHESAACDAPNPATWVSKPQGVRNCTKQQNGKRYIWRWQ